MTALNSSARVSAEPNLEPGLELSRWQRAVFSVVLCTIHQTLNVITSLILFLKYVWSEVIIFQSKPLKFEDISNECKGKLTKWPSHISFAFLESPNQISLKKISHLVVWALASGAKCVSLYDIAGHLKQKQGELLTEIRQTFCQYHEQDDKLDSVWSKNFRLEFHPHQESESSRDSPSSPATIQHSGRNGGTKSDDSSQQRVIHLSLLSARDGRQDLVETTRRLAERASNGQLDIESIDENLISAELSTNRGLPDPTILIRFGLSHSNLGFLPWQIRLTEIYDCSSLRGFTFQDFFYLLCKYSKCEQRFGR